MTSQHCLSEGVCCQRTQLVRLHQADVEPCGEGVSVGGVGAKRSGCQGRHEDHGGKHDEYDLNVTGLESKQYRRMGWWKRKKEDRQVVARRKPRS